MWAIVPPQRSSYQIIREKEEREKTREKEEEKNTRDNPVAPWFVNGDDENGGPDASTHFMASLAERRVPVGSFSCFFFLLQGGFQITHCCILGALLESRFDFRPFLLRVRGQSSPDASPLWRITTNEEWKVGRMTEPSRKPSRYDREKPYHFEVRMKL